MIFRAIISLIIGLAVFNLSYADVSSSAEERASTKQALQPLLEKAHDNASQQDIKKFATAISVIKRYYIKDTTDANLFNNAIRGMVSNLDPHSSFLDPDDLKELKTAVSGEFVGVGIELTTENGALKVISPLEGTPAYRAGVKSNDLIIKINGKLVQDMNLRDAVKRIKGKRGSQVILTILRKNSKKPIELAITRDAIKLVTVKDRMLEKGYGYVRITFFQGPVDNELKTAIEKLKNESNGKLKGFVLDLRNNPGGLLDVSAKVVNLFLNSNKITHKYNDLIVYTKGRIPGSDISLKATPGDMINGVPMIVLINGGSASASEIVAGALQDYKRAIIMGTRSFGKGSVQTVIPISGDSAIKLTTALYHTPSGRVIQARGIRPDVMVPELEVNEKTISGLLDIDESDYEHHILNGNNEVTPEQLAARKKLREEELSLAKEDYQIYEALMMLKGLNAVGASSKN